MIDSKEVDLVSGYKYEYSICTLVTDLDEYRIMKKTFYNSGFNKDNSEFIYIDNCNNKYDAYEGINKLINASAGKYIIVCHQDIELIYDKKEKLDKLIKELDEFDKNWGVIGNVGGSSLGKLIIRISDPHGENVKIGHFPELVQSLDENFLILKNEANIGLSNDLSGFHLYGTDICKLAKIRGYNSYVVDFHLLHKSPGNVSADFIELRKKFINKYQKAFSSEIIQTTCTNMFISSSKILNLLMSQKVLNKIRRVLVKKIKRTNNEK